MRVRFQADADLDGRVVRGLRRAAPEIDIRTAADAQLEGVKDPEVLRIAAQTERILVSQDRRTMPAHFARFLMHSRSPGVIVVREAIPIAVGIEELMLIWSASEGRRMGEPPGVDSALKNAWVGSRLCPQLHWN
jgi:predicted nuclease of predicted toxin-antitoxin system